MENLQESIKTSTLEYLHLHGGDMKEKLKSTLIPMIHEGIHSAVTEFFQKEVNAVIDEIVNKSMEEQLKATLENINNGGEVFSGVVTENIENAQQMSPSSETASTNHDSVIGKPTANKKWDIKTGDTDDQTDVSKAQKKDGIVGAEVNANEDESAEIIKDPFVTGGKALSSSTWSSTDDKEYATLKTRKNPFATDDSDLSSLKKPSVGKVGQSALRVIKNPFDLAHKAETAISEVMSNPFANPFAPGGTSPSSSKWSSADEEEYAALVLKNPFAPGHEGLSSFKESGVELEEAEMATAEIIKSPPVPANKVETATPKFTKNPFAPADKGLGSLDWSSVEVAAPDGPQQQATPTSKSKVRRRNDARSGQKQGRKSKTPCPPRTC